jgi:caffeoyl-CoA O-methyltransferase
VPHTLRNASAKRLAVHGAASPPCTEKVCSGVDGRRIPANLLLNDTGGRIELMTAKKTFDMKPIKRTPESMRRRKFIAATSGTGLFAALGGWGAPALPAATSARPVVPPDVQAARDQVIARLEANLGMSVPPADGQFLNLLVHVTEAKRVLEIGTFRGYSGIWMGMGLEQTGGELITVEIDPRRVKEAGENFQRAGLSDRIQIVQGDGHRVAEQVEGPFDLVFLDADKGNEVSYFEKLFPKLRPGGFLVLHNAISFRTQMKPYLDLVAGHPELIAVTLSLTSSDGMSVSFRKRV